jgi:hypothetical protein
VSVSDLYITTVDLPMKEICGPILEIYVYCK